MKANGWAAAQPKKARNATAMSIFMSAGSVAHGWTAALMVDDDYYTAASSD